MQLQQHMNRENHIFPLVIKAKNAKGMGVMPKAQTDAVYLCIGSNPCTTYRLPGQCTCNITTGVMYKGLEPRMQDKPHPYKVVTKDKYCEAERYMNIKTSCILYLERKSALIMF